MAVCNSFVLWQELKKLSNMCLIDCISKQNFLCTMNFPPKYAGFLLVFSRIF